MYTFNEKGEMWQRGTEGITQFFPKPGWVEHDAEEIWATQLEVAKEQWPIYRLRQPTYVR